MLQHDLAHVINAHNGAALLHVDEFARCASAQHERISLRIDSWKRAGAPFASQQGIDAGSAFVKARADATVASLSLCVMTPPPSPTLTVARFRPRSEGA